LRATLVVRDTVKETSAEAIRELKQLGLIPVLLTGDNGATAKRVAAEVGIERVLADVYPADKVAEIKRLQQSGEVVAALNLAVHRTMVSREELIARFAPVVLKTAHDISLGMGHRVAPA